MKSETYKNKIYAASQNIAAINFILKNTQLGELIISRSHIPVKFGQPVTKSQ